MKQAPKKAAFAVACALFFFSGVAALIYEVLWMKQLSMLFANSAQAAAATLAAFFAGIASGNAFWGHRAATRNSPLKTYGFLELGVTVSAVLFFALIFLYDTIYPTLFSTFANSPIAFTGAKFALALILFFPAAFFMGGTLPVMTQYLVSHKASLGKRASVLYAINTVGAASGAIAAGFFLPQTLGIDASYLVAMVTTGLVAAAAIFLARMDMKVETVEVTAEKYAAVQPVFSMRSLSALSAVSGFASLALQVLWIRMFAQVLHNSVYSYAAILSVFLVALAIGGAIARLLAGRRIDASWFLPTLMTLTALLVAGSPLIFNGLTDGSSYIGGDAGFWGYMLQILWLTIVIIGIPTTVIGILLPYLFKLAEGSLTGPGETVGRLVTINTIGAILGSIVAGFVLLDWLGLWASIKSIAILYIIGAMWSLIVLPAKQLANKLVPVVGFILLVTALDSARLPVVQISESKDETLLQVWEGADATVAVVEQGGYLRTKLNNWYTLGSTGDMTTQQIQTHLPMLLHTNPQRVFYLGLGTGITAGVALEYNVEKVVVTELAPSVIRASQAYFAEYTNGLYDDSRVTVIAEDGRNVLRGSRATYDLIISDLFIPWKAGTGALYSVEHYQTSLSRLRGGGMYAQWLPLYQLTQDEFLIIAKSMLQVFATVTIWRGNFGGERSVVALVGHQDKAILTPDKPLVRASQLALQEHYRGEGDIVPLMAHYTGMLRLDDERLSEAPINTDSHPVIEYLAPVNHRLEKAGRAKWFLGQSLFDFIAPYVNKEVLLSDSYISGINPLWHQVVEAGYYLHASDVLEQLGHEDAKSAKDRYQSLLKGIVKSNLVTDQ